MDFEARFRLSVRPPEMIADLRSCHLTATITLSGRAEPSDSTNSFWLMLYQEEHICLAMTVFGDPLLVKRKRE